jgi:hypothetical protein
MGQSKHDQVALRLARQNGATYNRGPGADVQSGRRVIEVESANTVGDASRQLRGYQRAVYVAGTDNNAVKAALDHYKNTTVGVMRPSGEIVKPSTRGHRR